MTITKEELDAMFTAFTESSAPAEKATGILPSLVAPDEPSTGKLSTSPHAVVGVGSAPGVDASATAPPAIDDFNWVDAALEEERRTPEPMAEFDWLKGIKGFTAPYQHPKLGRVLAIGYYEVIKDGIRRWFNCQVDRSPFFEVEALVELKRKTPEGRSFVKLIAWREGTTVRRWCRVEGSARNAPGHDATFAVRGDQLIKR